MIISVINNHTSIAAEEVQAVLRAINRQISGEGNTNGGGSREGVGVFRRAGRRIRDVNARFVDYSGSIETA